MQILVVETAQVTLAVLATVEQAQHTLILLRSAEDILDGVKHAANVLQSMRVEVMLMQNYTTQMDQQILDYGKLTH